MLKHIYRFCIVVCTLQLSACMTSGYQQGNSQELFHENMPLSILVLPPVDESVNESGDIDASYSWLTAASEPIAESGYYVFPVAVVDAFMKENGLSDPQAMHAVPPRRLGEVFGADAVMYATIEDFGQTQNAFDSVTVVHVRAQLVDVDTRQIIWSGRIEHTAHSTKGARNSLLGAVASTAVAKVKDHDTEGSHIAARVANWQLFRNNLTNEGLMWGPAHPEFEGQARQISIIPGSLERPLAEDGWYEVKPQSGDAAQ